MTMFDLSDSESDEEDLAPEEMPLEIRVKLDREVYFVGQDVSGVIEVVNEHKRRMRGIRLTLRCRSEVVWWEEKIKLNRKSKVKHLNDDDILYTEKYVVGNGHVMFLEPGKHQFPFTVPLKGKKKRKLPSSMEFPHGYIRYYLKAELDWPWALVQDHERLVSVIEAVNLVNIRNSLQPATFTKTVKTGLTRKKIHIAGRLEKIGYVPGEEILLHLEVDNASNTKIPSCTLQLIETVKYLSSNQKVETTKHVQFSKELGAIPKKFNFVKEKEPLLVPVVPQSATSIVEFMKVTHEVCISIVVEGKLKSVSQKIMVGTLPTKHSFNRFHMGKTPPENLCDWPFTHLKNTPCPVIAPTPPNPDVNWGQISQIDPEFQLQYVQYQFNEERAMEAFDEVSDSESEFDGGDSRGHLSEFSI